MTPSDCVAMASIDLATCACFPGLGSLRICSNRTIVDKVPTAAPVPARYKKNFDRGSTGRGGLGGMFVENSLLSRNIFSTKSRFCLSRFEPETT